MSGLPRSWLFVPADSERKLTRAFEVPADALILDLEDAVAAGRKSIAREMAADFLRTCAARSGSKPAVWVRVNSRASGLMADDVHAVLPCQPAGLLLPKAGSPADVRALDALMNGIEQGAAPPAAIMALVTETAAAVFDLPAYVRDADGRRATLPARLSALTWGGEDLSCELGALTNRDADGGFRFTYQVVRSWCQLAAAAAGLMAVETLCADFRNDDRVALQATRAAEDGFSGMLAIHPAQVPIINAAFTPTPAQVGQARRVLAAFAAAGIGADAGTVQLDGRMLDRPHRLQAERLLRRMP